MKKHDNTLYVTTQGAYLAREGTNVLVRVEKKTRMRVPIHNLGGIVCFGNVSCSPFVMGLCGREGVGISFLSMNGRFLARVLGPQSGNVLLRRAQHRVTSNPAAAAEADDAAPGSRPQVQVLLAGRQVPAQAASFPIRSRVRRSRGRRPIDELRRLLRAGVD